MARKFKEYLLNLSAEEKRSLDYACINVFLAIAVHGVERFRKAYACWHVIDKYSRKQVYKSMLLHYNPIYDLCQGNTFIFWDVLQQDLLQKVGV